MAALEPSDALIEAGLPIVEGNVLKPSVMPQRLWMSPIRHAHCEADPKVRCLSFDIAPSRERRKKERARIEITAVDLSAAVTATPPKNFRSIVCDRIIEVAIERGWVCQCGQPTRFDPELWAYVCDSCEPTQEEPASAG